MSGGLYSGGGEGGYNQMYFFGLQVDPGPINKGLTTGSLRYKLATAMVETNTLFVFYRV